MRQLKTQIRNNHESFRPIDTKHSIQTRPSLNPQKQLAKTFFIYKKNSRVVQFKTRFEIRERFKRDKRTPAFDMKEAMAKYEILAWLNKGKSAGEIYIECWQCVQHGDIYFSSHRGVVG